MPSSELKAALFTSEIAVQNASVQFERQAELTALVRIGGCIGRIYLTPGPSIQSYFTTKSIKLI